jgi:hypothetical protein
MSHPELTRLYQVLMEERFRFLTPGEHHIDQIYTAVRYRHSAFCDDSYLCVTNCGSGHNQPEWMHRVRVALNQLKKSPGAEILKSKRHCHWIVGASTEPPGDEEAFVEGREVLILHRSKERNAKVVRMKKQATLSTTGCLQCEACAFDFQKTYGTLGAGFAECHHRTPLRELTEQTRTKLSDLAIVCANCHRMLHRRRDLTVELLKEIVDDRAAVRAGRS